MSIKTSRPTPARSPQPSAGPRATGDHALRLRQDGGTYHGIAAVGLDPGHRARPALQPPPRPRRHHHRRGPDQLGHAPRPRGCRRHPAAAPGPARDGPRLGPHRPRRRRPPDDHPRPRPRRHHDHQPPAARRDHRRLRRLVGQARPRTHSRRTPRGHRRPQTRHQPGTGAPPPPWTTTCSTPPATSPAWGWKPATGTGTAPDIYPPVLQQKRTGTWPTTNA